MITSVSLDRLPPVPRAGHQGFTLGHWSGGRTRGDGRPMTPAGCVAATGGAGRRDAASGTMHRSGELTAGQLANLADRRRWRHGDQAGHPALLSLGNVVRITTNFPDMCRAVVARGRCRRAVAYAGTGGLPQSVGEYFRCLPVSTSCTLPNKGAHSAHND